ncbi:hypothetical protein ACOMHN_019498 [Nucella lapillus]
MSEKKSRTVVPIKTMEVDIENTLKHNGTWEEAIARLGKCQTNVERLRVVLSTEEALCRLTPDIAREEKSVDRAESLRSAGNEHFKCARYDRALSCYSDAVRYAPHPAHDSSDSSVLALSLGNRSAALFHLKKFHSCLADIDNALEAGFPPTSLHKLLDRRGKSCLVLKQKRAATEAFQQAREALLTQSTLQDKSRQDMVRLTDQFIAKCQTLPEMGENSGAESVENMVHEPVPKLKEASSEILSAAEFLVLKEEEGRGRGLYAKRDIKIGEVLIVEKPYASVVLPDYCQTHCHHCCTRCFGPLPCEKCVEVVFCSASCRQAAQTYHTVECGLMDHLQKADVRLGHLALKMVAKAGYAYLKEQRHAFEDKTSHDSSVLGFDEKGVYDSENYPTMYHLVGHSDQRTVRNLWSRTLKAVFLVKCLEQTGFFPSQDSPAVEDRRQEDLCYVGSHILRHLMMLPCNAHEVSEMGVNWQEPSQSQTLEIGSAIYPVLSLINHSCDPSVVRHSYGNVCVVRAIRGIAAGGELFDNYGALYPVMGKGDRQDHLQEQYYFTCQCAACVHDWPLYMSIPKEVMNFYCGKCRGRVPVPGIQEASKTDSMACQDCGHRQNIRGLILKVGSVEQEFQELLYQVIFSLQVQGNTLPRLLHFLRVVDQHLHRPVACHNDCQEAVKMCYAYKANAFPRKIPAADKAKK